MNHVRSDLNVRIQIQGRIILTQTQSLHHLRRQFVAAMIALLSIQLVCSCGTSTKQKAKSAALKACNDYTGAGIGAPPVTAAVRRMALNNAVADSAKAAEIDPIWADLRDNLAHLQSVVAGLGYSAKAVPAGQSNFNALAGYCEQAGQKP